MGRRFNHDGEFPVNIVVSMFYWLLLYITLIRLVRSAPRYCFWLNPFNLRVKVG